MKIMTILGTRPEIIRLSRVIPKLDAASEHVLVHTGQNYDRTLKDVFFDELGVRAPDHTLAAQGSFGAQVAVLFPAVETLLQRERPDRLLILGDTNSGLAAVLAKRAGIPVYHMEAGNRCFDDRVPEEVNRRIIDHSSDVLMPYTERSRQNLLREGIPGERIFVTGNPIKEVIDHYAGRIAASTVLARLGLEVGSQKSEVRGLKSEVGGQRSEVRSQRSEVRSQKSDVGSEVSDLRSPISDLRPLPYILVTMHRAENVDVESRLRNLTRALELLYGTYEVPIIVSTHPRTRSRMAALGMGPGAAGVQGTGGPGSVPAGCGADDTEVAPGGTGSTPSGPTPDIRFLEPFGFFDFLALERNALCVVSDSGTVQEECCILKVPNVTIRDVTERPETIECGSNILAGSDPETVLRCVKTALAAPPRWTPPPEYLATDVSDTVVRIVTGYRR